MAAPNFFPSYTVRSANASPVIVHRRPKEFPKGSLPIYSRPQPYGQPSPPHALRTRFPLKGRHRGKGAEGVLSRRHRVDDETKQVLKQSEDLPQGSREDAQDDSDFYKYLAESAMHLRERAENFSELATKECERIEGIVAEEVGKSVQIIKEAAREREDRERKVIESRRIRKAQEQLRHQARMEYREFRRDGRRAGLR
ncbi:hypothetical protein DENSPDRAFT_300407 [Dentipellis sp. KUC8613]|nr:hypothetical protein DENSPDRAFT_300407 [Dentipellis sp. KUC8613]